MEWNTLFRADCDNGVKHFVQGRLWYKLYTIVCPSPHPCRKQTHNWGESALSTSSANGSKTFKSSHMRSINHSPSYNPSVFLKSVGMLKNPHTLQIVGQGVPSLKLCLILSSKNLPAWHWCLKMLIMVHEATLAKTATRQGGCARCRNMYMCIIVQFMQM